MKVNISVKVFMITTLAATLVLAGCIAPLTHEVRQVSVVDPDSWRVGDLLVDDDATLVGLSATGGAKELFNAVIDRFKDGNALNTNPPGPPNPYVLDIPWLRTAGGSASSVINDSGAGTHGSNAMVLDAGADDRPYVGTLYSVNVGGSPEHISEAAAEVVTLGTFADDYVRFNFDFRLTEAVEGELKFGLFSSAGSKLSGDNDTTNGDNDSGFAVTLPLAAAGGAASGTASLATRAGTSGSTHFESLSEIDSNGSVAAVQDTEVHQAWLWFRRLADGSDGAVRLYVVLDRTLLMITDVDPAAVPTISIDEIVIGLDEVVTDEEIEVSYPQLIVDVVRLYTYASPVEELPTLDAFFANNGQPNAVFFNDGSNFTENQVFGTGYRSWDVALGDVDGDGDLDAVVANHSMPNIVWLNNGSGTFSQGQVLGTYSSYGTELGDLDGDGDLDAFFANAFQPNRVFHNDGNGNFSLVQTFGASYYSWDLSLGDVDGDGDLDAIVANYSNPNVVWLNNGNGTFTLGQTIGIYRSLDIALDDFDGDGDLDAYAANWSTPNTVFRNNGGGVFTSIQTIGSGYRSREVSLGDLDSDGDIDAIVANEGQPNVVWINNGSSTFTLGQSLGSLASFEVALGDVDKDGDLDAVFANGGGPASTVWSNDGAGSFTLTQSLSSTYNRSFAVALGKLR